MSTPSFLCVCLNPTLQKTLQFASWQRDQVNRTETYSLDASGKGVNVCRVLTQLGKNALHITQLGGHLRDLFINLCERDRVPLKWAESGSEIRFCYTILDQNDHSVTELVEESEPVGPGTEKRVLELYQNEIKHMSEASSRQPTLVISGTKAQGFSSQIIPLMTELAAAQGFRIILDIKGKDLESSLPCKPYIIKPNLLEFCTTYLPEVDVGRVQVDEPYQVSIKALVITQARRLARDYGCAVIISRGSKPIWVIEGDEFYEVPLKAVVPLNTTGSGDAFTAGLASALDDGLSLSAAVQEGLRCGALNASLFRPGVIYE
ncbi:1-phosphofructokinase family hexose kinase [Gracilinema caldarium]|uniref:1-phosphofructokinase family hexose kinase n=1 Tax=Gracilinema caldarium TaxID=215591 RepID=UPI0026F1BF15|nr:PfkB family carbohydrate kinase [Gracilinema caldarium]